ncbi:MAG: DUF4124 domain-containing protein [Rhodoferax sp.]|nr:DUF4124 domain-containing protein [Rhodoferax sp.]MBP6493183.1 DUF4124 domain-containing protein [Rhodoferax sp.]
MTPIQLLRLFLLTLACTFSAAAFSQWQWIDKDGRRVFSDRAPPPEVPQKNILKQPSNMGKAVAVPVATETVATPEAAPAATPASSTPKILSVDKDLEAKKKQVADAEAAKRKADEERVLKARIENCARAKQAKTTFDSGVRVARTNAAGEREIMDDAARAAESKRIQAIIDSDCK